MRTNSRDLCKPWMQARIPQVLVRMKAGVCRLQMGCSLGPVQTGPLAMDVTRGKLVPDPLKLDTRIGLYGLIQGSIFCPGQTLDLILFARVGDFGKC